MPKRPRIPHLTKKEILAPDIKIIIISVKTITIPCPKSGSNIIRSKKRKIILKIGKIPLITSFTVESLLARYLETKIIKPILANSEGWIPKEPIPNQLRAPFRTFPIPGIKTSTNKIKQINKILLAYL